MMWFDEEGWLPKTLVRRQPSPNHDTRPMGTRIDSIVVHCISLPERGRDAGLVEDLFLNHLDFDAHPELGNLRGLHVSAHFLIDRQGAITQYVSCDYRAWHAGLSSAFDRHNFNHFSIGIELLGDVYTPFAGEQYLALKQLILELKNTYPLKYIFAHSEIAPGRKTDPGPFFDWNGLRKSNTYELDLG